MLDHPRAALAALLTAALAVAGSAPPASAKAEATPDGADPARARVATVSVEGYGHGHGRGLSQYGAQRRAKAGHTVGRILDFYYPGTAWGRAGGRLRILVSDDSSSDLVVQARPGLRLVTAGGRTHRLASVSRAATRWRSVPVAGGRNRVDLRGRQGWRRWRTFAGEVAFTAGGAPLRLYTPSGSTRYRGVLRSVTPPPGSSDGPRDRDTVNVVPMEAYLRGVVPEEIPAGWEPHAVRAQAVAARTYAAHERVAAPAGRHYDLCSSEFCQVYEGVDAEHPASDRAVRATARRVRVHGGGPAFTQFSASNGGWTAPGPFPYLKGRRDRFDPRNKWSVTLRAADLEAQWPAAAPLASVEVVERDGSGDWGGRAVQVRLTSTSGRTVDVAGETFRLRLGLRSTLLRLTAG